MEVGDDPAARRGGARVPGRAPATRSRARVVNELGLPREALVNVIVRGDEALLPRGSTTIEAGDRLHILVRERVRGAGRGALRQLARGPARRGPRCAARAARAVARRSSPCAPSTRRSATPATPSSVARPARRSPAAHAPRRAGRARPARGCPLRRDRRRCRRDRRSAPAVPLLPGPHSPRRERRGARLVAGAGGGSLPGCGAVSVDERRSRPRSSGSAKRPAPICRGCGGFSYSPACSDCFSRPRRRPTITSALRRRMGPTRA